MCLQSFVHLSGTVYGERRAARAARGSSHWLVKGDPWPGGHSCGWMLPVAEHQGDTTIRGNAVNIQVLWWWKREGVQLIYISQWHHSLLEMRTMPVCLFIRNLFQFNKFHLELIILFYNKPAASCVCQCLWVCDYNIQIWCNQCDVSQCPERKDVL